MKSKRKKRLKSFETQTLIKKRREEERGMYLFRKEEKWETKMQRREALVVAWRERKELFEGLLNPTFKMARMNLPCDLK